MRITILVDNTDSWILPYTEKLAEDLKRKGHIVKYIHAHDEVTEGDICLILSCRKIVKSETLAKNRHNLVVHESALPSGRGWSPLSWQILEGKNEITTTLLEAVDGPVDSGDIYLQDTIELEGHELINEIRAKQGEKTIDLILKFLENFPNIEKQPQLGIPTTYPRRRPKDSELDTHKSLGELFNNLRIADNELYPAFFCLNGKKYILKIYKE